MVIRRKPNTVFFRARATSVITTSIVWILLCLSKPIDSLCTKFPKSILFTIVMLGQIWSWLFSKGNFFLEHYLSKLLGSSILCHVCKRRCQIWKMGISFPVCFTLLSLLSRSTHGWPNHNFQLYQERAKSWINRKGGGGGWIWLFISTLYCHIHHFGQI